MLNARTGAVVPCGVPLILSSSLSLSGEELWDKVTELVQPLRAGMSKPDQRFDLCLMSRARGGCGSCDAAMGCSVSESVSMSVCVVDCLSSHPVFTGLPHSLQLDDREALRGL